MHAKALLRRPGQCAAVVVAALALLATAGVVGNRAADAEAREAQAQAVANRGAAADAAAAARGADLHAGHSVQLSEGQRKAIELQQAAPVRGSEFRANCLSSHRGGNDPIVKPGQTGASHIHEFFGNRSTNANSTLQSLGAATTNCDPSTDLSAYWVPTLYKNGVAVPPESVIVYYQGITNPATAKPYPPGLKIVVGNSGATSPDQNP